MPPSPVVIDLRGWNEKAADLAEAAGRPVACRRRRRRRRILDDRDRWQEAPRAIASMSAQSPNRCTGDDRLVFAQ